MHYNTQYNKTQDTITEKNIHEIAEMERKSNLDRTLGEKVADKVAATVGSWPFIITQSCLLFGWVILNLLGWIHHWDPYPFILLNLALSFQAAYASPIIMMSQNRQGRLSERRNHLDLQINLLAEQENTRMLQMLRQLCEKMDIHIEDPVLQSLEKPTKPKEIVEEIEKTIEQVDTQDQEK